MRLSEFDDVVIELAETDMEEVEQTQVRARPARPDAPSRSAERPNSAKRELDLPGLAFRTVRIAWRSPAAE